MTAAVIPGLAVSAACDSADALPDLRAPDWLDGAAGGFGGVEGCRAAGAAPRGRGAAAAETPAKGGPGQPRGPPRLCPAAPPGPAEGSARDPRHPPALPPAAGPPAGGAFP